MSCGVSLRRSSGGDFLSPHRPLAEHPFEQALRLEPAGTQGYGRHPFDSPKLSVSLAGDLQRGPVEGSLGRAPGNRSNDRGVSRRFAGRVEVGARPLHNSLIRHSSENRNPESA